MTVLIVGNMGYVGSVLVGYLRDVMPAARLIGFDSGLFAHCLIGSGPIPEYVLDDQIIGDVRTIVPSILKGVQTVINLAAISNDPMGERFGSATLSINHKAAVELAAKAKQAEVGSYVYASSCSVYGCMEDGAKRETSPLDPLTAYARSKVFAEKDLLAMGSREFPVTCLRFATACGMSPRLRLDLVLNDFVAGASIHKKITVLSDGSPWRPLINVKDMARAIHWGIGRQSKDSGAGLVVNVGSNDWNCQVKDLAMAVGTVIPDVEVSINKNAQQDKRSYRVNYDLFQQLAPRYQPQSDLKSTILELKEGLEQAGFRDQNFRQSQYMRLRVLDSLRERGLLTEQLDWSFRRG